MGVAANDECELLCVSVKYLLYDCLFVHFGRRSVPRVMAFSIYIYNEIAKILHFRDIFLGYLALFYTQSRKGGRLQQRVLPSLRLWVVGLCVAVQSSELTRLERSSSVNEPVMIIRFSSLVSAPCIMR